ncbi:MAG TPA: cupin domain-containing protein [Streptosporangiaceae bacterium]|nr:cupin domain-containing protein [Streptosporangiaceae bacterium]
MTGGPAARSLGRVPGREISPGVTVRQMLTADDGGRGLHQRRLGVAGGARLAGTAGGRGEAWYVISGTGSLDTERTGDIALAPGTAVWLEPGLGYAGQGEGLEILAVTVRVLAGQGLVHLDGGGTPIGPGTSVYLPPLQPHCLENTGTEPLLVLGVFHPAGSPAAKQTC